jgi:hypothetical protein
MEVEKRILVQCIPPKMYLTLEIGMIMAIKIKSKDIGAEILCLLQN